MGELDDRFHETCMIGTYVVDGGFLVLRLAKRGAASWQDGGEQSNWQ
jgi:hypothetical protein